MNGENYQVLKRVIFNVFIFSLQELYNASERALELQFRGGNNEWRETGY